MPHSTASVGISSAEIETPWLVNIPHPVHGCWQVVEGNLEPHAHPHCIDLWLNYSFHKVAGFCDFSILRGMGATSNKGSSYYIMFLFK